MITYDSFHSSQSILIQGIQALVLRRRHSWDGGSIPTAPHSGHFSASFSSRLHSPSSLGLYASSPGQASLRGVLQTQNAGGGRRTQYLGVESCLARPARHSMGGNRTRRLQPTLRAQVLKKSLQTGNEDSNTNARSMAKEKVSMMRKISIDGY